MKIKHTLRVLAVVLVLAMMPLYLFACGGSDSDVGGKLADMMVGDGSIKANDDNPTSKSYIKALDEEVTKIEKGFSGVGWSASSLEGSNSTISQWAYNIYKMSLAWATKGSDHYHSGSIIDKITAALESNVVNQVGTGVKITISERLDSVEYLTRALVILDDAGKVDEETLEKCLAVIDTVIPAPFGDSVNYARTLYIVVASAAIMDDAKRIETAATKFLPIAMTIGEKTSGGLFEDGSYLFDEVASSASHGVLAFNIIVDVVTAISVSDYDFTEETKSEAKNFLYNWAVKSIVPSLYNGSAFSGMVGLNIANADGMGGRAISALLALADYLEDERSDEINAIVKGYSNSNNNAFATGFTSFGACKYQKIAKDDKIEEKKVTGAFSFAQMDKLSILGNKYSVSLSLSSDRSVKYETRPIYNTTLAEKLGAVNGTGWNTGDGMLLLYTKDYKVNEQYWTYVNAKRIPGTTSDSRDKISANDGNFDGITSYAGSAVLGSNAVSSYYYFNNNAQLISDLTAKKSYFFFDGKIVALGAGITNTYVDTKEVHANQTIETTIENIMSNSTSIATSAGDVTTLSPGTVIDCPEYLYVIKYGGIYIPADKNDGVNCRLNSANNGKTNFIEVWIDHGKTPENATYEYAIIPSSLKSMAAFFEYVSEIDYEVLSNTTTVQAVKDNATGLVGYTFWEAGECNGIATDFACNMMVKENDKGMTIALSDYTHNGVDNRDGNTITIPAGYTLKGNVAGVTLEGNVLTIDRAVAADGNTITIQLTK